MIIACGVNNDIGFDRGVFHVVRFLRVVFAEMDNAIVVNVIGERGEINSPTLGINRRQIYHAFSESSDSSVFDVFSVEVRPRLGGLDENDCKRLLVSRPNPTEGQEVD
jgi:hypothetical protein